jgi:hypothetical protein
LLDPTKQSKRLAILKRTEKVSAKAKNERPPGGKQKEFRIPAHPNFYTAGKIGPSLAR